MSIDKLLKSIEGDCRINCFARIIKYFNIKTALEVGVRTAQFASDLMFFTSLESLIGIDMLDSKEARQLMIDYPDRYKFQIGRSPECSELFLDESFDLIYLDDNHSFHHLKSELPVWYKKVKQGKILAGHDFMEYTDSGEGTFGVIQAVTEFCDANNLTFYVTGCVSTDKNAMIDYGIKNGRLLSSNHPSIKNHEDMLVPNWFLIKQ